MEGCETRWFEVHPVRHANPNGSWQIGWLLTALEPVTNLRIRAAAARYRTTEQVEDSWSLSLERAVDAKEAVLVMYDESVAAGDFPIRMTVGVNGPGPYEVLLDTCDRIVSQLTDLEVV